ncbi:hypothetical protein [Kangiella spongicola]|uniref:Uncharacterized protein n=1 Tax=Kangiella spongicola TaxID=796379 RepID=A0A318D6J1_9GAMM|nr:hypothetical protein [Kangiella spongicola]PXF62447.1 hypothetical protein DL796_11655 [Kangiella spongicola]
MNKLWIGLVALTLGLMGCKTTEWDKEKALPATIVGFDKEAKDEIAGIINQIMPGANVALADDIFSTDNRLFIQRKPVMVDGNPAQGRITEMPRKFELYHLEDTCFLVDSKSSDIFILETVSCNPMG